MTAVAERPAAAGLMTGRNVGWAGAVLALLTLFIAVPPISVRSAIPVIALAVLAVAAGAYAIGQGLKRLGWATIAGAVVAAVVGVAATKSGVGNLERVVAWSALLAAMLRYATPLALAALGGLFSERSGVINIALEGMMLMGAFFAVWGADISGSWLVGLLTGVVAGVALASIHAVFAITLRADQIVSGTALNFLALGLTGYLYIFLYGEQGTPQDLPGVPSLTIPGIDSIPFVGDVIGSMSLMIWLMLILFALAWVVVFRTPSGLRLRAAGENPLAAETAGLSVVRTRYIAVMTSGALAALGGAYLSLGFVNSFSPNMTAGRGFIALAALIFGMWRPGPALLATLLFGFASALAQRLPVFSESGAVLFQALPYVLTLVAVAGLVGRSVAPAALGRPLPRN